MRRSTVLSLPRQLVFPAGNINQPSELNTFLLILGIGKFVEKNAADADADADAASFGVTQTMKFIYAIDGSTFRPVYAYVALFFKAPRHSA